LFSLNIDANVRRLIVSTIFGPHAKRQNILYVLKGIHKIIRYFW